MTTQIVFFSSEFPQVVNLALKKLMLLLTTCVLLIANPISFPTNGDFGVGIALADDEDDGDDSDDDDDDSDDSSGGGSSGNGGGGSGNGHVGNVGPSSGGPSIGRMFNRIKKQFNRQRAAPKRQNTNRQQAPRTTATLPTQAPSEIVAIGLSEDDLQSLTSQGYSIEELISLSSIGNDMVRLRIPSNVGLASARETIRTLRPQADVDFNHYYRTNSTNGAEAGIRTLSLDECKNLECAAAELISWPATAWNDASCTSEIRVGLIDTGINHEHDTFSTGQLSIMSSGDSKQRRSGRKHGTAVAALLLGDLQSRTPGLLPKASIFAVDAFQRGAGNDERSDVFSLIKALDMLADKNVSVINMSLAGPKNVLLEQMVKEFISKNTSIVAAAGNGGPRSKPVYPAALEGVIAVTAVDRNMRIYRRAARGDHIDFAAPGVNVWTAASIKGARPKTGTSFAAPFVTAALALAKQHHREKSPAEVVEILAAQAVDLGEPGRDPIFGYGLIQAVDGCGAASD